MAASDTKVPNYPEVVTRLKVIMKDRKWNQSKLARRLNKDHGQVSRWFSPGREMRISSLLSICKVMEISPALLFKDRA